MRILINKIITNLAIGTLTLTMLGGCGGGGESVNNSAGAVNSTVVSNFSINAGKDLIVIAGSEQSWEIAYTNPLVSNTVSVSVTEADSSVKLVKTGGNRYALTISNAAVGDHPFVLTAAIDGAASTTITGKIIAKTPDSSVSQTLSDTNRSIVFANGLVVSRAATATVAPFDIRLETLSLADGSEQIAIAYSRSLTPLEASQIKFKLPDPNRADASASSSVGQQFKQSIKNLVYQAASAAGFDSVATTWTAKGWYGRSAYGRHRVNHANDFTLEAATGAAGWIYWTSFSKETSAQLDSYVDVAASSDSETVLFVHGYAVGVMGHTVGGGRSTWSNFPALVQAGEFNTTKYRVKEFRWSTDSSFRIAADDLVCALIRIKADTNQKIHIVAHSFGGVLTRVVLQKINGYQTMCPGSAVAVNNFNPADYIASVVTLGSPHSGIADTDKSMHGVAFPAGQDAIKFEVCTQISCHQMGEQITDIAFSTSSFGLYDAASYPGEIAAQLSQLDVYPLPTNVPITLGIGMGLDAQAATSGSNGRIGLLKSGDGLISYAGQRFHPRISTKFGTDALALTLLDCGQNATSADVVGSNSVREVILGAAGHKSPGMLPYNASAEVAYFAGYFHASNFSNTAYDLNVWPVQFPDSPNVLSLQHLYNDYQAGIESCTANNWATCQHASFLLVQSHLTGNRCAAAPALQTLTGTFTVFADQEEGYTFTAPVANSATCAFSASGTWREVGHANYGPSGIGFTIASTKFPSASLGALIALQSTGYVYIGTSQNLSVLPNESIKFLFNDVPGSYGPTGGNSGSVSVVYSCN